jgi:phospholipid/cholesterol/gamma-HCH transport system permease protein
MTACAATTTADVRSHGCAGLGPARLLALAHTVPVAITQVDRASRTANVALRGDLVIPTAQATMGQLRGLARRRDLKHVVLDFSDAGRVDTSGVAVVSLVKRQMARAGKQLELANLRDTHKAAFELIDQAKADADANADHEAEPLGFVERVGVAAFDYWQAARELVALIRDIAGQTWCIIRRQKSLPKGALADQIARMGTDALPIVSLLGALLGTTLAFQGVVLLHRFGAGQYVADMIGLSMIREFGPMMTAIIVTGRTGAAIAAELGTMRVGSEIDALEAMGVSPTRFLLLPRLAALTFVQPALSLISMFVGIAGGMLVTALVIHVPPAVFWDRIVERCDIMDFVHGLGKSVLFAWIIGLAGSHLGMRATADATSVGAATTRTVVVSVFFIIMVDAVIATIASLGGN